MGVGFRIENDDFFDFNPRPHWSYSGFSEFRQRLAQSCANKPWIGYDGDPIVVLLTQSDCDGRLSPDQCKNIVLRLVDLIADWKNGHFIETYDYEHGMKLANMMLRSTEIGQFLIFC